MADSQTTIVDRIIKEFGPVIDLRESPEIIIDIVRRFGPILDPDGGLPPGGTPPPPPPGPAAMGIEATLDDVMRELLRVSKQVTDIRQQLDS